MAAIWFLTTDWRQTATSHLSADLGPRGRGRSVGERYLQPVLLLPHVLQLSSLLRLQLLNLTLQVTEMQIKPSLISEQMRLRYPLSLLLLARELGQTDRLEEHPVDREAPTTVTQLMLERFQVLVPGTKSSGAGGLTCSWLGAD